jgi:predicted outer membrane repeat protein
MTKRFGLFGAAVLCWAAVAGHAATLTVTTDADEANCNCNGAACSPNASCVHLSGSYPASTGCSLREALQNIADKANNPAKTLAQMSFPECGLPDSGTGNSNTIALGTHTINVYSSVPNPGDSTGTTTTHNTQLPFLQSETNAGSYSITDGSIQCSYDAKASPVVGGNSIFTTNDGSQVTFQGTAFHDCTAPADGVAIVNLGNSSGTLTLTDVTFTNIRATNQGNGGCIETGSGNFLMTNGSFTTCVVDDGGAAPGGGHGNGGAIYIGGAGGTSRVAITGVTFQANVAGDNGGAIYLNHSDAVAINTSTFQANVANGNTNSSDNPELGGGAIYALSTATGSNDGTGGLNASAFLLFQDNFLANTAPQGTGGAILLSGGGKLTYGTLTLNLGDYQLGKAGIPGGVVASNFSGNLAGGTSGSTPSPFAGTGGAIYANGYLAVYSSSFGPSLAPPFIGNKSVSGAGGAIAYRDSADSYDPLMISNTSFNGNSALNGGAIANIKDPANGAGQVTLINDTISGNSATNSGGGIYNEDAFQSEFNVSNTILANNTGTSGKENCGGTAITDVAANLQFNPGTGCGTMHVGDPELGSWQLGGGLNALVYVMELGPTSYASKHGDPNTCSNSPIGNLDEALNSRPQPAATNCDIGAYESSETTPVRLQSFTVE